MLTPGGSVLLICWTAEASRCAVTRVFSPGAISATPTTAAPARVFAEVHQCAPHPGLAVALAGHRTEPRHRRLDHLGDLLDVERRPAGCGAQHDIVGVADRL